MEGTLNNIDYNKKLHETKEVYHQMAYDLQKRIIRFYQIMERKWYKWERLKIW